MAICLAKHTKFQPTDDQWLCPQCGVGAEYFDRSTKQGLIINYQADDAEDCELLHLEDEIWCARCDGEWTGKKLAAILVKKENMVSCPHCKGKGMIRKPTP